MSRRSPSTGRPLARAVLVAAVLVLGVMAALRLPLGHLPADSFPELRVELHLAEPTSRLAEMQRLWLTPVETAIRSIGAVESVAGDVSAESATLRVRLAAGADAERKAARLESELAEMRRRLEEDDAGRLSVAPVGPGGGDSLAIWIGTSGAEGSDAEDDGAERKALVQALRDLPSVRSLEVAGTSDRSLRWTLRPSAAGVAAGEVASALAAGRSRKLGRWSAAGRSWPVHLAPSSEASPWVGSRPVRLESVADAALGQREPGFRARVGGRPGVVLSIARFDDVSPLELERQVLAEARARLGPSAVEVLWSQAEPIRELLRGLVTGGLAALLLSTLATALLLGGRAALWQSAAVPLAAAAALNALWLLGLSLDLTTSVGLVVAVGAGLLGRAVLPATPGGRLAFVVTALLAAWIVPLALRVLGQDLGGLLSAPVLAFAGAVTLVVPALLLLPPLPAADRPWARSVARFVLRRPWTVVLVAVVLSFVGFGLFGDRLVPRSGELRQRSADLVVWLEFARGATLEEATARVVAAEAHLLAEPPTDSLWTFYQPSMARLAVRLRPEERHEAVRLARLWRDELGRLGASVRVEAFGGAASDAEPLRFGTSLAARPHADSEGYRFVLRSTDPSALLAAHRWIRDRLTSRAGPVSRENVTTRWTEPSPRLELRPRPGATPAEVDSAVATVGSRLRVIRARAVVLPGGPERPVHVEVATADAPPPGVEVEPPQLAEVLASRGSEHDPVRALALAEGTGAPTLRREDGRFVLPVTVSYRGFARGQTLAVRDTVHRRLARIPFPGVDVERPSLHGTFWTEERMRLLAVAGVLPFLFLALAVIRLDSVALGLATWVPPTVGLVFAAFHLVFVGGGLVELALLALAASLAASLPVVLETASALRLAAPTPLAGAAGYRWLVHRLSPLAVAALAWASLAWGAGWGHPWGAGQATEAWVTALRLAGSAGLGVLLACALVLPGLLRAADALRFHDPEVAEDRAHPPAWETADLAPTLEVHRLTKIYPGPAGEEVRALDRVSFRLEPGIVGLLGPNGAGKTTLLRHLCGLLRASRGQVLYRGVPLRPENLPEFRRLVGFLPQEFNAYEGFTAESFLDFWAIERGISDRAARRREVERLLRLVDLEDVARRRVRNFSGGMRRRIGIARSLLGAPPILVVDEPTTGLDVESRNRLRESLLAAAGERIILFSTHIASDVAAAASRILLLHRGRLLFDGRAGELIDGAHGRVFETLVDDAELREFSTRYRVTTRVRTLDGLRVRAVAAEDQAPAGEIVRPNLEEAYLARLGETAQKRPSSVGSLLDLHA